MKFSLCHNCGTMTPASKEYVERGLTSDAIADIFVADAAPKCPCGSCSIVYLPPEPGLPGNMVMVQGPCTIVGMIGPDYDVLRTPKGQNRKAAVQLHVVMRTDGTVLDLDVDPEAPKDEEWPTHIHRTANIQVKLLSESIQSVVVLDVYCVGARPRTLTMRQWAENYKPTPADWTPPNQPLPRWDPDTYQERPLPLGIDYIVTEPAKPQPPRHQEPLPQNRKTSYIKIPAKPWP